jgi:hypothetical protein
MLFTGYPWDDISIYCSKTLLKSPQPVRFLFFNTWKECGLVAAATFQGVYFLALIFLQGLLSEASSLVVSEKEQSWKLY